MSKKRHQEDEDAKTGKKIANYWSMGLLSSMKDPELQIKEDDKVVIIKDKYPKVNKLKCTRVSQLLEYGVTILNFGPQEPQLKVASDNNYVTESNM
jgi:hypothetical protein